MWSVFIYHFVFRPFLNFILNAGSIVSDLFTLLGLGRFCVIHDLLRLSSRPRAGVDDKHDITHHSTAETNPQSQSLDMEEMISGSYQSHRSFPSWRKVLKSLLELIFIQWAEDT